MISDVVSDDVWDEFTYTTHFCMTDKKMCSSILNHFLKCNCNYICILLPFRSICNACLIKKAHTFTMM